MLTPVEEIKSKLDIVDIVNEHVPLKQAGANFKAPCPFHDEKTPSFMVSRERQFFKCFGCSISGDIFTFLMKIENIEFPEALQILAEKAGVKLVRQDPALTNLKTRLYDLHSVAVEFFIQELHSPAGRPALEYLTQKRRLSSETIKFFNIGLAPNDWNRAGNFLKSKGFSDYEIKQSGLVVEKNRGQGGYYDRFRNRIMFPIQNHNNKYVGFTARALDPNESAKYINTPQTTIYNKSQILFGLNNAKEDIKKNDLVVLVEGQMDVIASHIAGVKNIVAISGTSTTVDQIKIIQRYTTNVAMCFDQDIAGVKAAERSIEMLWQAEMNIKVVILPSDVKDPDELIQKNPQAWQEAVSKATNFMDYFFSQAMRGRKLDTIDDKRAIAKILLPWIARLVDPISQNHYIKLLSEKINIDEITLQQALGKYGKDTTKTTSTETEKPTVQTSRKDLISQRFLATLVYNPGLIKKSIDFIEEAHLSGIFAEFYKNIIIYYTKNNTISSELVRQSLKDSGQDKLVQFFDALELLAKTEFEELSEADFMNEHELAIKFLKNQYLANKKSILQNQIKQAESKGDINTANKLLEEYAKI